MSINVVTLVGRLTKDLDLKYTPSGVAVVRFTLAVNRSFKREGEAEADFISCVAFNKTAENLCNFMRKGSQIGVIGRIQTGSYEKDGARIYTTDVVADNIQFLEPRAEGGQGQTQQNNGGYQQQQVPQQQSYQQPQPQYQQKPQYQQQPQYGQQQNQNGQLVVDEDSLPF